MIYHLTNLLPELKRQKNWLGFTVLIYSALLFTLMSYLLTMPRIEGLLLDGTFTDSYPPTMASGLLWVFAVWVGYLLIPIALLRAFGEKLCDYGFHTKGLIRHLRVYLVMSLIMLPILFVSSLRPEFQARYPFVQEAKDYVGLFILWEIAYVSQFFCIEFFFRGFFLHSIRRETSHWLSIGIMVLPYTMVHFHKPLLEVFGAIIAGVILGHWSLKYRSWIGGAILHSVIGVSMDAFTTLQALGAFLILFPHS